MSKKVKLTISFEYDEDLAKANGLDSEVFALSIQDYLQAEFGNDMNWHNNDPDIEWEDPESEEPEEDEEE